MPKGATAFLVTSAVADVRASASHKSELVTQTILGQHLTRLRSSRDRKWYLVSLPDEYVGWVRGWSVVSVSRSRLSNWVKHLELQVGCRNSVLRRRPSRVSDAICELVIGTRLPKLDVKKGWVRVALPDGTSGWLEGKEVEPLPHAMPKPAAVVRTAGLFLGAPYLWGGTTPWGCDCSGLVQSVYSFHGIALPRDTGDQLRSLRTARMAPGVRSFRRGDLLFFGRGSRGVSHVAISTGGSSFIHAYGDVRIGDLRRGQSGYLPEVSTLFRVAARPL